MSRLHFAAVSHGLLLWLATFSPLVAWQLPDELPSSTAAQPTVAPLDLVPAEQIVAPGSDAAQPPADGGRRSVFSDNATPSAAAQPSQPAPALQPTVDASSNADQTLATPQPTPSIDLSHLKATVFKGIEPGHTTVEQLKEQWGEPQETKPQASGTTMYFALAPFPRVEATVIESRVAALVIHLAQPAAPATVVEQLGLADLEPIDVLDRGGRKIGDHFPERGVTLVKSEGSDKDQIVRILLESLRGESFLLRVQRDRDHRWQRNLHDLDIALRLDERDHRAWWLKSEALAEAGDEAGAASAVARAIAIDGKVPSYQLTAARLAAKLGKFDDAQLQMRAVLDGAAAAPILQARAALVLGDLLADAPQHKFDEALAMHQRAIEIALPLASDPRADLRRAAKHTLVEAHLAIADDIARGKWQKKSAIVPQWLARSRMIADELIASDAGDAAVLLDIGCRSLATYAWMEGEIDPTPAMQQVQAVARKFCADCDDSLFTREVDWKLGKALVDAVDSERTRRNTEEALAYGRAAEEQLAKSIAAGHRVDQSQFQLARLCFLLGSIEAVQRSDHAAAVKWFEKALDRLARPEPEADLVQTARRGQWLVSMGISYWQQGDKTQGLKLTELGANLVEAAHREGAIGEEQLAVPYHNLAFMYKQTGEPAKAEEFAQLAAQINSAKLAR